VPTGIQTRRAAAAALAFLLAACGGDETTSAPAEAPMVRDDDIVLGSDDAPVTIIEFASVACGACAAFHAGLFPEIKRDYIDTGKVRFVMREFPASDPTIFWTGSRLARCAANRAVEEKRDEAYLAVVSSIFAAQRRFFDPQARRDNPTLVKDEFVRIAGEAGLTEDEFVSCIKDEEALEAMRERFAEDDARYGISGTPAFVIDGVLQTNLGSKDDFIAAIEKRLPADG